MPIRRAEPDDVPAILNLIRELAEYERAPDEVIATEAMLHDSLFALRPAVFAHVAEVDGQVVGFALWYVTFSTWLGRHGLWLEDLYVQPAHRGSGLGRGLLATLAGICTERGYGRLEWWVLDWNAPALGFYRSLAAEPMDEWTVQRLSGAALDALAAEGSR